MQYDTMPREVQEYIRMSVMRDTHVIHMHNSCAMHMRANMLVD